MTEGVRERGRVRPYPPPHNFLGENKKKNRRLSLYRSKILS